MEDFGVQRDRLREQNDFLLRLAVDQRRHVHDLEATLRGLTETASRCLGVERVGIWELEAASGRLVCRDRYDREAKSHGAGHLLTAEGFPAYFAAIASDACLAAEDVRLDRRFAEFVPAYAQRRGTVARLDVVLTTDAGPRGVMMFEEFGPARLWTNDERRVAASLAEIAARSLAIVDERAMRDDLERLHGDGGSVWLLVESDRTIVRVGPGSETLFDRAAAELAGTPLDDVLPGVELQLDGEEPVEEDSPFGDLTTITEDTSSPYQLLLEAQRLPVRLTAGDRAQSHVGRGDARRDVEVGFRELRHGGRRRVLVLVRRTSVLEPA